MKATTGCLKSSRILRVMGFSVGETAAAANPKSAFRNPQSERAGSRIRTDDLLITNQLLYQLSYTGVPIRKLFSAS
jgi:hypothetical protein